MDSLITAAAIALAAGDPLGALNYVALRDDAPALALRGIAMAQLGDFGKARALVQRAKRGFGTRDPLARARCIVIEAEIALASRDLRWPVKSLDHARAALEAQGDRANATHARYLAIRRLLLIGRLREANAAITLLDPSSLPSPLKAIHELTVAGIAMRDMQAATARKALTRASAAARKAGIPALIAEIETAEQMLDAPVARLIASGTEQAVLMQHVEKLLSSRALVVDANRYTVHHAGSTIAIAKRPILFALLRALAETWPVDVSRQTLIARVFRTRHGDETHRARLRVEIGRLRGMLKSVAEVNATADGFQLIPHHAREVIVLARPVEEKHAAVLALLADGESWSSSALALALGSSQRNVQRALDVLLAERKVQAIGRGRSRRWMAPPMPGFATSLLLPVPLLGH